jgi:hypothetical protein
MSERYTDRLFRQVSQDTESQGLYVKISCLSEFLPLQGVKEIPEEPDMLHIIVSDRGVLPVPEEKSAAHYFVHKSQVIFRTLERLKRDR